MRHVIRFVFVLIVYLLVMAAVATLLSGCTTLTIQYEHVSHPFAGPPFGPNSEEDALDQIQACGKRSIGSTAFVESCLGYRLTDGGFYGPPLTGTVRAGFAFDIVPRSHNDRGGYINACGNDKPGMLGDDC